MDGGNVSVEKDMEQSMAGAGGGASPGMGGAADGPVVRNDGRAGFLKKQRDRRRRRFSELGALSISAGASLILALVIVMAGYDGKAHAFAIHGAAAAVAGLYLLAGLLSVALFFAARSQIDASDAIGRGVRLTGLALLPFAVCGNVFAAIAAFTLAVPDRTIEYRLAGFALLNNLTVMLIAAMNLFKEWVVWTYPTCMLLLAGTLGVYAAVIFVMVWVGKREKALTGMSDAATGHRAGGLPSPNAQAVSSGDTGGQVEGGVDGRTKAAFSYKKLIPLAILLILMAVVGNIFSLLLGLVIISKAANEGSRKIIGWLDALTRIYRNYMSVLGLFIIGILFTLALCSTFLFDYELATVNDYAHLLNPPSIAYPFGTDNLGRDVFTRVVFGTRVSFIVGLIVTAVPLVCGGLLGAMAGYYENRLDNVIMRILDVFFAVPSTLLAIAIVAAFGASLPNLIVALSIANIPVYARTMRAQVLVVTGSEFVEAAKACGRKPLAILLRHVIPNSLAPMIVRTSVSIGIAVLSTSALSYLGLGVDSRIPEWGNVLRVGSNYLETNPYLAIYPGIFIIVLVLAFNFLGDGLRDALDPKLK
ncbi:MAG: ABC transporter permease [Lachnospiraceae bacterium]|jgi:peptide/nickel transport system permease protein|nr:ABC transporter permease [Lachnospiraceae bacterium]